MLERYQQWINYFNGMAVEVPTEDLQEIIDVLSQDSLIQIIEPDLQVPPVDPTTANLEIGQVETWGMAAIGASDITSRSAEGVEVYIIDSGISNDDVNVVEHR